MSTIVTITTTPPAEVFVSGVVGVGGGGGGGTWGTITGTLTAQVDLNTALNAKVPGVRTITINGTTQDLTDNRAWVVGGGAGTQTLDQTLSIGDTLTVDRSINLAGKELFIRQDPTFSRNLITFPTVQDDTINTLGNKFGSFHMTLDQTNMNPDGQMNSVFQIGYNQNGSGSSVNPYESALWWALESHYQPYEGAQPNFEMHIQYSNPVTGFIARPWSMNVNKGDGHTSMFMTTDQLYFWPSAVTQASTLPYAVIASGVYSFGAQNINNTNFVIASGNGTAESLSALTIQPAPGGSIIISNTSGGAAANHIIEFVSGIKFTSTSPAAGTGSPFNFNANVPQIGQYLFRLKQNGTDVLNIDDGKQFQFSPFSTGGVGPMRLAIMSQYGVLGAAEVGSGISISAGGVISYSGPTQVNSDWDATSGLAQILNKPTIPAAYTDEQAQDAIGAMVSSEFTYVDATPLLSINTIAASKITGLTSTSVGLGNVNNTSDVNKPVSTATQTALDLKADLIGGIVPTSQLPDALVGIVEVANYAALPGTGTANTLYITLDDNKRWLWATTQYLELGAVPVTSVNTYIGAVVLVKADVGLGSADNTSDAAKPVSTAQQTALDLKATKATTLTINGSALDLSANRSWSVGTVTNTSVVNTNGFNGSFASSTTTPALTISTTVTGLVKGNGTALSAAILGTDYAPGTSALGTGIIKSTTGTGAFTIAVAGDFPVLNQNTTGTSANITQILSATSFPALIGDVTTPSGSVTTTLATVNINPGSWGTATQVPVIATNGKGLITSVSHASIQITEAQVTNLGVDLLLKANLASPTFTGTVTMPTGTATVSPVIIPAGIVRSTPTDGTLEYGSSHLYFTIGSTRYQLDQQSGGGGVADGDKGDITVTGTGTIWTIDNGVVSLAKMADMATASFIGRNTAATGVPEVLNITTVRTMLSISNVDNTSDATKNTAVATFTNKTITALVLTAGGTGASTAPIKFSSGTSLLATPEAGTWEYDNKVPYFTHAASKRGVVEVTQIATIQADFTLTSGTALQPFFTATHDVITLEASTSYKFRGVYIMTTGTTTHTTGMAFALGGGGSVTSVEYRTLFSSAAANAIATAVSRKRNSGVGTNIVAATSTAAETMIEFEGFWRQNAAGTVTPQIIFSAAPGGTNLAKVGSFIEFTPMGSNSMTFVGQFS